MPVPTLISELSQTPGSNFPLGSESPSVVDDYFRTYASFIAQHRDGKGYTAEATLASAATADIGAQNSFFVQITGTTTITSFGTNYNGPRYVRFAGALTLTHNATTLILPGGANIVTAAGDRAILTPVGNPGSGWQVLAYQRADGILPIANGGTGQTTAAGIQSILPINQGRAAVASASVTNLTTGAPNTDQLSITGTTTINSFTVAAGRMFFVRFGGALTLVNSGNLATQSGANILTAAGDTCVLLATAANTVEVMEYTRGVPQALGDGQTWQSLTGSRALSTTYTNSTGRPIAVSVQGTNTSNSALLNLTIAGVVIGQTMQSTALNTAGVFGIVPPGATYSAAFEIGTPTLTDWNELR